MSVDCHFPGPPDTHMPKSPDAIDELGIRYHGSVLTGRLGVRQAFRKQAYELCGHRESNLPDLGRDVQAVDPVMAAHRAQFGRPPSSTYVRHEQYDAVLRSHLHMEPAPDPYDAQRRRHAHWESTRHQDAK